jgi:hypothetical protein
MKNLTTVAIIALMALAGVTAHTQTADFDFS